MSFKADAEKIKRWREERHWSQEHLAELAGLGLRTIQRIENGDAASQDSLRALAAAYNVDVMALAVDQEAEIARRERQQNAKAVAALRLSLGIHFAGYVIGMAVFIAISIGTMDGQFEMLWPMLWWTVGFISHAATVGIVEMVARFQNHMADQA